MGSQRVGHNWSDLAAAEAAADGKESACKAGDLGSIPGWEDPLEKGIAFPGEGNGNSLQYSCLENPMDGGAWWATVHRVAKSQTRLSDFTSLHFTSLHFTSVFLPTFAWRVQGTEEPGRLQSMGLQRVEHNWVVNTKENTKEKLS